jgi:hypothetical protein
VCYPFCREAREALAVKRREFITLLGGAVSDVAAGGTGAATGEAADHATASDILARTICQVY